ncbi:CBS domain-containing protein [Micromonospora sp. C28SCA-DRY-2]|uniref:CBS domain-containing protein n=1 Tax=Micromonospora sp. C28SCA-DRY-2 TaxID=3059522 RepID=UPI002674BEA3|nr:CBS domain-containing protein [Micromonospora sp. C28SCA-DRY-2]MDO3705323.1 CBS domain-containing protein [Micromonospora sp. C28SCA-DRY-2]
MRTWQVGDVMTRDVATVDEETPYRAIVDVLVRRGISAVPVVDRFRRVLGVVSEADLLHKIERAGHPDERRVFAGRRRRSAREKADALLARDLMTAPPVTTYPGASLPAAARQMDREQVKRLPVLDDLGRLVGIVTRGDLLRVHLRTDAEIREDVVQEVLRRVLAVEDGLVTVRVRDGEVTLDGRLDRRTAVELAGRLAGQVSGVVRVTNTIAYDVDDHALVDVDGRPTPVA